MDTSTILIVFMGIINVFLLIALVYVVTTYRRIPVHQHRHQSSIPRSSISGGFPSPDPDIA